jgi:hypothetical protein
MRSAVDMIGTCSEIFGRRRPSALDAADERAAIAGA